MTKTVKNVIWDIITYILVFSIVSLCTIIIMGLLILVAPIFAILIPVWIIEIRKPVEEEKTPDIKKPKDNLIYLHK